MLFGDVGDSGIYILRGELGERCMTGRFRAQRAECVQPSSGQQRTGDSEICKAEEHYLRDGLLHAIECRCGGEWKLRRCLLEFTFTLGSPFDVVMSSDIPCS